MASLRDDRKAADALKTLSSLEALAERARRSDDAAALNAALSEATAALDVLRKHHTSLSAPVEKDHLNGNGHA